MKAEQIFDRPAPDGEQGYASGRVSVFIGGVQKGGTSALHAYLARHPDLCPPPRKELHFFDDETRDWRWPCGGALDRLAPGMAACVSRRRRSPCSGPGRWNGSWLIIHGRG
jgi:hypothetical protein